MGCRSFSKHLKPKERMDANWTKQQHKVFFHFKNDAQLERYLKEVLENNNNLKALALTKQSLLLQSKITKENIYPSGDFSLKKSKENISMALLMNWEFDVWGKLSNEFEAMVKEHESMENRYLEQKRILLLNATLDWMNYWYFTQVLENQKLLLKKYSNLSQHYLDASNAGLKERYFYLETRRTQELVQNAIFESRLNLLRTHQQLNLYRGLPPSTPLSIEVKKGISPIFLEGKKMKITSKYLGERYDVKEAFLAFESQDFLEKASYKALLPQFNLSLGSSKSVEHISKLFSGELLWEFIGGITQPIFHAKQLHLMAKQKSLQAQIAWQEYQEVVLNALLEIENILITNKTLEQQLAHKRQFQESLSNSLLISKEKAVEGITNFADYLQEEASFIDEKNALLTLKIAYIKNRLRLMSALGEPIC